MVHNTYRLNAQPGLNPLRAPDLTASYLRADGTHERSTVTARIGNGGELFVPAGIFVAFYDADPDEDGQLLGRTMTTRRLDPGEYEDVSIIVPTKDVRTVWVVADDDGTGQGQVREPNEENNKHHAVLASRPPDVVVTIPADGAILDANTTVVLSGYAVAYRAELGGIHTTSPNRIAAVLVNGVGVEVLDAGGHFFTQVDVLPGENVFHVTALDAYGQTAETMVTRSPTRCSPAPSS